MLREDIVKPDAAALLDVAATPGEITEDGLRNDISVGIQYIAAWLGGSGAVAIFNLMEDAATSEISRAQVWQWLDHGRFHARAGAPGHRRGGRQARRPATKQAALSSSTSVATGEEFVEFPHAPRLRDAGLSVHALSSAMDNRRRQFLSARARAAPRRERENAGDELGPGRGHLR